MNYLPIFAYLYHRPVLVIGGGIVAKRKIEQLYRAGAYIKIVASQICNEIEELIELYQIEWISTKFDPIQLDNVFLVIAATNDAILNENIYKEANIRFKLVNVVDDKFNCNFIFPAIIDRSPVLIAISSSGTSPILVRILREKLEALLPKNISEIALIAGKWRNKVKKYFFSLSDRRRFWERIFNGPCINQIIKGNIKKAKLILHNELNIRPNYSGKIILVGTGPGDSNLLTLRALQVMQLADVVLYDNLVSKEVLELVRRDAEFIFVGKKFGCHIFSQKDINTILIKLALQGKYVVRLKGGDPFIFGRGGEEIQAAKEAGVPFQVVPGITAAIGATVYAGIPLTHRDYAHGVTFITGHDHLENITDCVSLILKKQTLIIYMGITKATKISNLLVSKGCIKSTPIAIISKGTRQDQKVLIGTLEKLGCLASCVSTPALIVIGEVVNLHSKLTWFNSEVKYQHPKSCIINLS
ncbi:uroporphyrinogen-III C-methyltransferase [Candidatus Pantoea edessiphila]|uniref:Siroheme synthase n=1 Tax=Candidatus Pantoea edessiphila TaxID=2044610 RepID=A0A2P5SXL7_9GAMM|nr:siroheme synthase CysG [Candidatus Pantoea edessiphila]MBK4775682.1 uroporphyrinogen-III C-methyltransferase [Pantoea sp. Edef]PPI87087.1 uroporphyrinogen-III C-methyltransferase [Candidatus Pantoea edessiphila]